MLALVFAASLAADPTLPPPPATDTDPCGVASLLADGYLAPDEAVRLLAPFGRDGVEPVLQALRDTADPEPEMLVDLFETLAAIGGHGDETLVRPHVFSPDPEVAIAATRALASLAGQSAVPTLEHVVRADRSFGQTLVAIELLRDAGLSASFSEMAKAAENPARHPILRVEAVRSLPLLDALKTRRWLKAFKLPIESNPFFAAEVNRLMDAFANEKKGGSLR